MGDRRAITSAPAAATRRIAAPVMLARGCRTTAPINHANPKIQAAKAPFKAKGKFALSATCDADCTVTTGGAAKPSSAKLAQNAPGVIVASPTKKAKKKGKGSVTLTATDQTGGTATTTIKLKVGK